MSSLRYIAFGCFVLLALSECADGLRCYQCTGCDSPFKPSDAKIVEQANNTVYSCSKFTAVNVLTKRDITASCSQNNIGGFGTWCCNTDLCNGATPTASSIYLIFTVATVIITMLF